jgi:hypothetical protein
MKEIEPFLEYILGGLFYLIPVGWGRIVENFLPHKILGLSFPLLIYRPYNSMGRIQLLSLTERVAGIDQWLSAPTNI